MQVDDRPRVHDCVLAAVDGAQPAWWPVEELIKLPRTCADEKLVLNGDDVYVVRTRSGEDHECQP